MKKEHEIINEEKIIYKELSYLPVLCDSTQTGKIMQAVFEIHNNLGPGYSDFIRVIRTFV